jgi:hypothetical protein
VLLGFVAFGIHEAMQGKHTPRMDFRAGFWVLPWLGGLALISWLGSYPEPSSGAGNLGLLGLTPAIGVIAVFSALIMWLAHTFRLPAARVEAHIADPSAAIDVDTTMVPGP